MKVIETTLAKLSVERFAFFLLGLVAGAGLWIAIGNPPLVLRERDPDGGIIPPVGRIMSYDTMEELKARNAPADDWEEVGAAWYSHGYYRQARQCFCEAANRGRGGEERALRLLREYPKAY